MCLMTLLGRTIGMKLRYLVLRALLRPLEDHAVAQLIVVHQAVGESDAVGAHGVAASVIEIPVGKVRNQRSHASPDLA